MSEILSRQAAGGARPGPEDLRRSLEEKGVSASLIEDALFLYEVLGDMTLGRSQDPRATRILSSEELRGLNPSVVGKLFRLYYLEYMRQDDLESILTDLLFLPQASQTERARDAVSRILGVTSAQADYLLDGGPGDAVIH
ncbi:DUF494 family protein [bacterium]|nr:DUF494 family protein [bacterium]